MDSSRYEEGDGDPVSFFSIFVNPMRFPATKT